jgi:amino acid transporter
MQHEGEIGFWGVVAIGVGGMVGGGIFAVLGLSVQLAGGGAPLAFLLAGGVALLTAYSYARLSVTFPGPGGTVEFLNRAFGTGLFSGSLNILLWLSYIIMLSLYAQAFGGYAASLFGLEESALPRHAIISAIVIVLTGLNMLGSSLVGRAETWIVAVKISILILFVAAGCTYIDPARLAPAQWGSPFSLVAGGMLIFLAYEGFELIANTSGDAMRPEHTLPRAYFVSVGFVIALYVAVAAVAVGNLAVPTIVQARDYALAVAARPFLGQAGFTLIGAAALLSTASAINATLYGAARMSYIIAKEGELPEILERNVWNRPVEGLLITAGATLVCANLFDLSNIAMMGSTGFLLVFAAVNAANARRARQTGARASLAGAGALACLLALGALLWESRHDSVGLLTPPAMLLLALTVEVVYRTFSKARRTHTG